MLFFCLPSVLLPFRRLPLRLIRAPSRGLEEPPESLRFLHSTPGRIQCGRLVFRPNFRFFRNPTGKYPLRPHSAKKSACKKIIGMVYWIHLEKAHADFPRGTGTFRASSSGDRLSVPLPRRFPAESRPVLLFQGSARAPFPELRLIFLFPSRFLSFSGASLQHPDRNPAFLHTEKTPRNIPPHLPMKGFLSR